MKGREKQTLLRRSKIGAVLTMDAWVKFIIPKTQGNRDERENCERPYEKKQDWKEENRE